MYQGNFNRISIGSLAWSLLVVPGLLWAQDCRSPGQNLEGLNIHQISIENGDIFDLQFDVHNLWIHRIANQLHIRTRKETIENLLLFEPGMAYSDRLVQESERLLRSRNYIHAAKISVEEVCQEGVNLTVVTTDNWTLTPSLSVSHSGGETRTSFEIEESNWLGLGSKINITSESDDERDMDSASYEDENWFGNFVTLKLDFSNNSDGHFYATRLSRPFIQLDAKDAWSIDFSSLEIENPIFEQSEIVGRVGEVNDSALFTYGWSEGLVEGSVSRYRLGWFANKLSFFTVDSPEIELPEETEKYYPFFEYEYLQVDFVKKTNFQVMGVTEDIQLGNRFLYRIGWKDEEFNSSQEGFVFTLDYNTGGFLSAQSLGLFELKLNHESNTSIDDTGRLKLEARLYNYRDENHNYLFSGEFEALQNPELFERLQLGGNSGLRGYPNRYQNGNRKFTLSAEKRVYFNLYLWQIIKFGVAAFVEAGSAWETGEDPVVLGNVGAGIRLISTRQSNTKVLHIDIAFPLSERDEVDSYQFFVKAKSQF